MCHLFSETSAALYLNPFDGSAKTSHSTLRFSQFVPAAEDETPGNFAVPGELNEAAVHQLDDGVREDPSTGEEDEIRIVEVEGKLYRFDTSDGT